MKSILALILLINANLFSQQSPAFKTEFELSNGLKSATYQQTIDFYQKLAKTYPEITFKTLGLTDSGFPLNLVIFNADKEFDFDKINQSNKNVILINNGIHPGEPDGIDASMMLLRDIVQDKNLKNSFQNIVIAVIPVYNIGGALNRNSTTRVNQNGPLEYGFRGNARNFDLNRDFIKNDTKNAQSFSKLFHLLKPDVFIDNHVSNGADYQYTLTHLFTQHNKLGGELGAYLHQTMMPNLLADLKLKGIEVTPYVNVYNEVPEVGFSQFMDAPRYSTGYTSLFNTLGMMVETHMLKAYKPRVEVTYQLMMSALNFIKQNGENIKKIRAKAFIDVLAQKTYPLSWEVDSTKTSTLQFKGFEATVLKSEITGLDRLKYDRTKPFTKPINYYDNFKPDKFVNIPKAYVIPQGFWPVIERLKRNKVALIPFKKDTSFIVEVYHISDYKTQNSPYEGHYLHYKTIVTSSQDTVSFKKGDYYVPLQPYSARYVLETLEPSAQDSFFNWNFFDTILQQKEGFSPYVFEDLALAILKANPQLKANFETKKKTDEKFAASWYAQLNYIYDNSKYKEQAFLKYPIFRVN